jgi:hypothetical protein
MRLGWVGSVAKSSSACTSPTSTLTEGATSGARLLPPPPSAFCPGWVGGVGSTSVAHTVFSFASSSSHRGGKGSGRSPRN